MRFDNTCFIDESESIGFDAAGTRNQDEWRKLVDQQAARGRLLLCIKHEISTTTIFIAACASLANFALANPSSANSARLQIARHMPPEPRAALSMLGQLSTIGQPVSSLVRLLDFNARMNLMRLTSITDISLGELASAWCALCKQALEMIGIVDTAIIDNGYTDEPATFDGSSVERLAFSAGHGGWPCVGGNGELEVPGWVERRDVSRKKAHEDCTLIADGISCAAKLIDISRYGAGIASICDLTPGQTVELATRSWGVIDAEVAWCSGVRCGLRFMRPLTTDELATHGDGMPPRDITS